MERLSIDKTIKSLRSIYNSDMEKLTYEEDFLKRFGYTKETLELSAKRNSQLAEWLEELKSYRDAEEQGLLLRLPCKDVFESSGDTVYYIFDYEIVECINCGVSIDCERKLWIALACDEHIFPYRKPMPEIDLDPTDWCKNTTEVSVDECGKTVFLTKEEAEQALAERKNDE